MDKVPRKKGVFITNARGFLTLDGACGLEFVSRDGTPFVVVFDPDLIEPMRSTLSGLTSLLEASRRGTP